MDPSLGPADRVFEVGVFKKRPRESKGINAQIAPNVQHVVLDRRTKHTWIKDAAPAWETKGVRKLTPIPADLEQTARDYKLASCPGLALAITGRPCAPIVAGSWVMAADQRLKRPANEIKYWPIAAPAFASTLTDVALANIATR